MKILSILSLVSMIIYGYDVTAAILKPQESPKYSPDSSTSSSSHHFILRATIATIHSPQYSPDTSISSSSHPLNRRATIDELSKFVEQMHSISSLLTGISLERGLLSNSIPVDELISELLNFGNLTSAQVQGIDPAKLTGMVEKINALSKPILHDNLEAVEKHFFGLSSSAQKVKGFNGKLEIPANNPYLKLVEGFNKSYHELDFSLLTTSPNSFLTSIKNLNGAPETVLKLSSLHAIEDFIESFNTANYSTFDQFCGEDVLKIIDNPFPILVATYAAFMEYVNISQVSINDAAILAFATSVDTVGNASKELNEQAQSLLYVNKMLVDRHQVHGNSVFKHTKGYLIGLLDIIRISADIENKWANDAVDGQWNNIANALTILNDLDNALKAVDSFLGFRSDKASTEIVQFQSLSSKLGKLSATTSMLSEKVKDIKVDALPTGNDVNMVSFEKLMSDMDKLSLKLKALHKVSEKLKSLKLDKNKKHVDAVFEIVKDVNSTSANEKFAKFNSSKDVTFMNDIVLTAKDALDFLEDSSNPPVLKVIAESVISSLKNQSLITIVNGIFDKINALNTISEIQHVQPVINAIRFYREATKEQLSLDSVAKILPNVKKELTKFTKFVNEKKKRANVTDPDVLEELKTTVTQLSVLGPATRGIFNMNMALQMKVNVSTVKDLSGVVKDEMAKVKLDPEESESLDWIG
ncbi:uncharacterized protein CELE_H04J21.1 [Caenorhabditis elegans]|uniref:Domain of unknown function WSN domain-containing protein n=1 Tax=Caenorhabditis elegans TaxID=6239 RepID=O61207_CAEEL|nr:protein of unknown function WSN domain-containing protein [Caenorhabditis elegans]CCD72175.2 Domain of unknown function WSN domain-containing protein [Caenorhabditis elegans]